MSLMFSEFAEFSSIPFSFFTPGFTLRMLQISNDKNQKRDYKLDVRL